MGGIQLDCNFRRTRRGEMQTVNHHRLAILAACLIGAALVVTPLASFSQTKIVYHNNRYKPADDVKLGRQAAAEAERQFPLLRDSEVTDYVESVGQRLVRAIPPEVQHPEFRYYLKVIDA